MDGGLSILQYADDKILFTGHDLKEVKKLELVLSVLEQISDPEMWL